MSKEKGEKKTVALTVVKVASTPRLFGDNGKAFLITTDEEQLEGDSYPFKLEVYQEDAVQPLKALIGQGPKEMTLAYVSSYPKEGENVVHNYKLMKAPGWEASQRSGQRSFPPDAEGRQIAGVALAAAASQCPNNMKLPEGVKLAQATQMLAEHYIEWIVEQGLIYAAKKGAAQPTAAVAPNGNTPVAGSRADYQRLVQALLASFKENDPAATEGQVKTEVVLPFCEQEGLHFPPSDDELPKVIDRLNDLVAGVTS